MNVTLSDEDYAWVKAQADDVGLEPAQMVRVLVNRMRKGQGAVPPLMTIEAVPQDRNGALPADPLAHLPRAMRRLYEGTSHPAPPVDDRTDFNERTRKAALLRGYHLNPPVPDVMPLGNAALDVHAQAVADVARHHLDSVHRASAPDPEARRTIERIQQQGRELSRDLDRMDDDRDEEGTDPLAGLIAKPHDPTADDDFEPGPDVEIPPDPDGGVPGVDLAELLSGVAKAAAAEQTHGPAVDQVMAQPPNMPFSRTRPAGVSPQLRGGSTPGEAGLNIVRENFSHLGIGRRG